MNPMDITSVTRIDNSVHRGVRFMQILETLLYITDFFTPGKELLHSIVENREQKLSEVESNLDIESKKTF